MVNVRVEKSSSLTPQPQAKSSRFTSPPVPASAKVPMPQDIENQAFMENKLEALGLQIQAKYDTITPQGQERLTRLQAKRDAFRRDRLKSLPDNSLLNIPNLFAPRETPQPIQPKLTIGKVGDKYEQEADRVAAKVVSLLNAPQTQSSAQGEALQREKMPDDNKEQQIQPEAGIIQSVEMPDDDEELQMKSMVQRQLGEGEMVATPDLESSIKQAKGSGQSLSPSIRQPMEQAFGADFSRVKVHTDAQSDQLNQSIQAKAFTTGPDIFFRQGAYKPGSRGGQELLAHELTHVIQQNGNAVQAKPDIVQRTPDTVIQRQNGSAVQRKPHHKAVNELNQTEITQIYSKFTANKRQEKLKEIVWEGHLEAISTVCREHKYTIAIRETGALSIRRIAEGAKAKPHTILEKSIKESSVKRGHSTNAREVLTKLKEWDLDGFVGHWSANHELIGVRIDKIPAVVERELENQRQQDGNNEPYVKQEESIAYVPLKLNQDGGGLAIKALKRIHEWKTYLYTGDYDLHEAYSAGAGGGQIAEATPEKVRLLNRLNKGIESEGTNSTMRSGEAKLEGTPKTVHVEGDYAMFQHGDQATYRMNQHLEAKALQSEVVQLVRAVATESDEPIAWCMRGEWFVTLDKYEHDVFRTVNNIKKPHTWSDKEDQRRTERGNNERRKQIERYQ